jgi:ribonuclease J
VRSFQQAANCHNQTVAQNVQLIPLGGLGEFGMNMMAVRFADEMVVIDAGLMFPEPELPGVDIVIPDATFLRENRRQLRAILLTHAHEDHIGALPWILEEFDDIPIYGTEYTLAVVETRLREHGLLEDTVRQVVKPSEIFNIGPFSVEYIHVTHSIVGACAIALSTPAGVVIHSGDFKIDPTPTDNNPFDLHKFADYGRRGVLALLCDSTNVERRGYTGSELAVRDRFDEIFNSATGRIFVCCFTSSIHRIELTLDLAREYDRKVAFVGRSMENHTEIAHRLGYLHIDDGRLLRPQDIRSYPREKCCILISGSQAEPASSLARAAVDDHKLVEISAGDTVILSSRIIPGNEKAIFRMINHLFRRGAHVIYNTESYPPVHVSGHASQEEVKLLINLVRPRIYIPIHGEYRQLFLNAELARSVRIPGLEAHLVEDGTIVELGSNGLRHAGTVQVGRVLIDRGSADEVIEQTVVRDRRHLAADGIVLPVVALDKQTGRLQKPPEIISSGFIDPQADGLMERARAVVERAIEESNLEERGDWSLMKEKVRQELKRYLQREINKRPLIVPVIVEI